MVAGVLGGVMTGDGGGGSVGMELSKDRERVERIVTLGRTVRRQSESKQIAAALFRVVFL